MIRRSLNPVDLSYFDRQKINTFELLNVRVDAVPLKPELIPQISRAKFSRCQLKDLPIGIEAYHYIKLLDLSENEIEDLDPQRFSGLIILQCLDLSLNRIRTLPPNLPSTICQLDLSFNPGIDLTSVWKLNLPKLEVLRIAHSNIITVPVEPPHWCKTIKSLNFEGNLIETIPEPLLMLPNLEELSLYGNKINKCKIISQPPKLKNLNLNMNPITAFDDSISSMTLQTMWLNSVKMDEIPIKALSISGLRVLMLSKTGLKGNLCFTLPHLLAILDLSNNQITGLSEQFVQSCGSLSVLNLSRNQIETIPDAFPDQLCFSQIILNRNKITSLPDSLLQSKSLEKFYVSRNRLTILPDFRFPQLRELDVSFNNLRALPDCFSICSFLITLNISFNRMTDLPKSITTCRRLLDLIAAHNQFTFLPRCVLAFASLRNLTLAHNKLTSLPQSISSFFFLKTLNLGCNHFTEIPQQISTLVSLKQLWMPHNLIENVPETSLPAGLAVLDLSFNLIQSFPDAKLLNLSVLSLDCNKLRRLKLSHLPALHFVSVSGNCLEDTNLGLSSIKFLRIIEDFGQSPDEFSLPLDESESSGSIDPSLPPALISPYNIPAMDDAQSLPSRVPGIEVPITQMNLPLKRESSQPNQVEIPKMSTMGQRRNSGSEKSHQKADTVSSDPQSSVTFLLPPILSSPQINEQHKVHRMSDTETVVTGKAGVGYKATVGIRPTMEDAVAICDDSAGSLFALFDGHAGFDSASRASVSFRRFFKNFGKINLETGNAKDPSTSLIECFVDAEQNLLEAEVEDGCTCVAAYFDHERSKVYCAGVGDSRIVRVRSSSTERMTVDHKPLDPAEYNRLRACGLGVTADGRVHRKLAIARALGDFWCPEGLFVPPSVQSFDVEEDDVALIVACDGLWDVLDDEEAGAIVREATTAQDAAVMLSASAIALGSTDNISIIVVMQKAKGTLGSTGFDPTNTVERIPIHQVEEVENEEPFVVPQPTIGRRRR